MKTVITKVVKHQVANCDSSRWNTVFTAHMECGHNKFLGKQTRRVGTKTECPFCK